MRIPFVPSLEDAEAIYLHPASVFAVWSRVRALEG